MEHDVSAAPADGAQAAADLRVQGLRAWLEQDLRRPVDALAPVSGDASFRRYFRLHSGGASWIVMDAPPEHESCDEFVAIARRLRELGLNAPEVVEADLERGYLLLSDFGDRQYLAALAPETADELYSAALDALERLQAHGGALAALLPAYDRALLQREMNLFPDWLLERHLGIARTEALEAVLREAFEVLIEAALEQPRVCVHRDYHSRNLMIVPGNTPGILDFQDAVHGPITYDLVSLLRDCYIDWPREQVRDWALAYRTRPGLRARLDGVDESRWLRWFDLMGLQRHLKASGIFARLCHRDGKRGYLQDIPRTVGYMLEVSARYPELAALHRLLDQQVMPRLRG